MPYNNYIESYCDVCGHVTHGSVPVLDGTPENHGLIFCCTGCAKIHTENVKHAWHRDHNLGGKENTPHREGYRHFCFGCENFRNLEPNSPRRGVWYNHVCCVSGDITKEGTLLYADEKFGYCRETIKECFKHHKPIKTEISRFELMDFE